LLIFASLSEDQKLKYIKSKAFLYYEFFT
jgi:hypothetical protein